MALLAAEAADAAEAEEHASVAVDFETSSVSSAGSAGRAVCGGGANGWAVVGAAPGFRLVDYEYKDEEEVEKEGGEEGCHVRGGEEARQQLRRKLDGLGEAMSVPVFCD